VFFRSVSRFAVFSFLFCERRNFFLGGIMKRRRQVSSGVVLRGEWIVVSKVLSKQKDGDAAIKWLVVFFSRGMQEVDVKRMWLLGTCRIRDSIC
jgi:hypothetical protein